MGLQMVTARLLLRPFDEGDLDAVHGYLSDRETMTHMGGPRTRDWVSAFLDWQRNYEAQHGYGLWAMVDRATGCVIGDAGIQELGGPPTIAGHRLRYMVDRAHWGRGYATEAARAHLDFAFRTLRLPTVKAITDPGHVASQRVLEKIGMSYGGLVDYDGIDGTSQVAVHTASRSGLGAASGRTENVMLTLNGARQRPLFESARALIGDEEPRGPALIVAQAAVEVAFETVIDFAMQMRQVYDPLREWATTEPVRSWSPENDRVRTLWKSLTDDTITQAPSWSDYKKGVKRRHDFAHWASPVSRDEAETFVDAAEQVVKHIVQVMADTFPDPVDG